VHANESEHSFEGQRLTDAEALGRVQSPSERVLVRAITDADSFPELKGGKVLVRYFIHAGTAYGVFEQRPDRLAPILREPRPK
jgi:hypothetical protein